MAYAFAEISTSFRAHFKTLGAQPRPLRNQACHVCLLGWRDALSKSVMSANSCLTSHFRAGLRHEAFVQSQHPPKHEYLLSGCFPRAASSCASYSQSSSSSSSSSSRPFVALAQVISLSKGLHETANSIPIIERASQIKMPEALAETLPGNRRSKHPLEARSHGMQGTPQLRLDRRPWSN